MTPWRLAGWAAVTVALSLAAALALLAADVLRWQGHLEASDLRVGGAPANTRIWIADARLPGDPAASLLAVDDDVALRRALQLFRLGNPRRPARNQHDLNIRLAADARLAEVGESDAHAAIRSRAAMLRGILALEEARGSTLGADVLLRRALTELGNAVRLDDANADAKYNLELVIRLLRTTEEQNPEQGEQQQRGGSEGQGAGSSQAGSGF